MNEIDMEYSKLCLEESYNPERTEKEREIMSAMTWFYLFVYYE